MRAWASYPVFLILKYLCLFVFVFPQPRGGDYNSHDEPLGLLGGWHGIIQITCLAQCLAGTPGQVEIDSEYCSMVTLETVGFQKGDFILP